MLYCKKCRRVFESDTCPTCGRSGRQSASDDICFLVEKEAVWAGMLTDVLQQEGLPFLKEGALGAGVTARAGFMMESYRFYVRCEDLSRAQEIVKELFASKDS